MKIDSWTYLKRKREAIIDGNDNIKAIIFDLGNVLIDFNHQIAAKRIAKFSDKSAREIFHLFFDSELIALFEEGKISASEFFLRVKDILNLNLIYDEFLPIWNEIFFLSEKNRAVYNLARALKEKYKLVLLSNINVLHFAYLKKNFPVFDAFQNIITSYEMGFRKPHPLIYQKIINLLQVLPPNIFYTDDRKELVAGARNLGIRSFLFKDIGQLKKDLSHSGVIS